MLERETRSTVVEVLERVLDKGIVIDAWVRVSLVGIDLVTVNAHVVVASFETYLKYAGDPKLGASTWGPSPSGLLQRQAAGSDRDPVPLPRWATASDPGPLRTAREAFEAWNGHDVDRYAALLAEGFICQTHRGPAPRYGRPAARRAMQRYYTAYPDLHFTIERAIASDDDVMVSWLATGTPRVDGRPARRFEVPGCTVGLLKGGKIVHAWNYWDRDEMLRPLRNGGSRGGHGPQAGHRGSPAC